MHGTKAVWLFWQKVSKVSFCENIYQQLQEKNVINLAKHHFKRKVAQICW